MPTARELLEQADKLMQRNRSDANDDIPVLTEAVPAVVVSRALLSTPPRVDPGPPSLPVLTENIDVIDDAEITGISPTLAREGAEGEPSVWLDFEDAEPSVIGDAPDSIAIVPSPLQRPVQDEDLIASAEHEEIELTLPREDVAGGDDTAAKAEVLAREFAAVEASASLLLAREAAAREAAAREAAKREAAERETAERETAERETAERETAERETAERETAERETAERVAAAREAAAREVEEREAAARELAALEAATRPTDGPFAVPAAESIPMPPVVGEPATPGTLSMADDDERWVAAAEEIRMQVLQRIDLFTDTGLRDQLTERLQPIADRASADFVAAINLHVGDLLRSYVAEAIEREIERWRRDN